MKYLIAALAVLLLTACGPNYSNGNRIGTITAFSNKGLIWKSWEGELLSGGLREESTPDGKGKQSVANIIGFNVSDPEMVQKIQLAVETGRPVRIRYSQWFIPPLTIDHTRVVTGVWEVQ